jgi:hypothetical protein
MKVGDKMECKILSNVTKRSLEREKKTFMRVVYNTNGK